MKPNFICIGAHKAGTTWLFRRLSSHPEFSMLPIKELRYFDRSTKYLSSNILSETRALKRLQKFEYAKFAIKRIGRSLRSSEFSRARWWARYCLSNYSDKWYHSLFQSESGLTGDITPSYSILENEDVARMRRIAPDARIIFLMRNPIDRAWSNYRYDEKFGRKIDCDDLDAFKRFVDSTPQELRSNYLRTIEVFSNHYDPSHMILGFYDAIIENPSALLSAILCHIGAEDVSFSENLHQVDNRSRPVEIPEEYRRYLESKYQGDLEKLSLRYGGYATKWYTALGGEKVDETKCHSPVARP